MARVIHVFRQPDRFVAGTVGEPGERTFYLQATEDVRTVSVQLEKQQVSVLAERIGALLEEVQRRFDAELPAEPPEDLVDTEPLAVPVEEEFRVGTMGLGWDAETEAVVVELLAVTEEEIDESVVLDDTDRRYTYDIVEGPFPIRSYRSTIRVAPVTATGHAFVEWWAHYDAEAADEPKLDRTFADGVYATGLTGLREHFSG